MQVDNLSWFPGHMTKTRRMITAEIKNMDAVCEILDARIPLSSRNPDVDELTAGKPRLVVLNRVDQADPGETRNLHPTGYSDLYRIFKTHDVAAKPAEAPAPPGGAGGTVRGWRSTRPAGTCQRSFWPHRAMGGSPSRPAASRTCPGRPRSSPAAEA